MSIVARHTPANLTLEMYEGVNRKLEEAGIWPDPDGLELHVLFGSEGDLRISEIWESREKMDAFLEQLMPIVSEAGVEVAGPPEIFEAHNIVKS